MNYSYETTSRALADSLKAVLRETAQSFEVSDGRTWSGEPMMWHFSICATDEQAQVINDWLDRNAE